MPASPPPHLRRPIAWWGLGGVLLLLANALWRLTPLAIEPFVRGGLTTVQILFAVCWIVMMAYSEGWRGFHQRFAPRVVQRAALLHDAPLYVRLLAPLACMGLVWATPKRQIVSAVLLAMIVSLVLLVRGLDYPWRGLVDAGVVVGLGIGTFSILWHAQRAWRGELPGVDPELPLATPAT